MKRVLVLFASLLAAAVTCSASQPANVPRRLDLFELGAPRFSNFSARDGLPDAVDVSVQTDRDGFVWAASPLGLARYDGHRWNARVAAQLPAAFNALTLDHDGVLWAAYRDHGLAHYDGKRWVLENRSTGLPTDEFRRVAETTDAAGHATLWALSWDQGLFKRDGAHWVADAGNAQLPRGALLSLALTHTLEGGERLWVGTLNDGLWFREGDGAWQRYRSTRFDPVQVEHVFASENHGHEELWVSAFGSGLWRLDDSGLREWSRRSGDLRSDELYDITQTQLPDGERAIWVGSRSGLVRVYHDRAQVFTREHGLSSDAVRGISAWRSPSGVDVLWLATEAGVSRTIVGADQWSTASLSGARAIGVFAVLVDHDAAGDERLWVGASGDGVSLYENGVWRRFSAADGTLPDADVRMIARVPDAHGDPTLWLGLRGGHLLRILDGPRFEAVSVPWQHLPGEAVMATVARSVDGHYEQWFATRQSGLYRLRDDVWTAFRPAQAVGVWRTEKLLEQIDADGKSWLWASSGQGLARFDGTRWDLLGADAGLPDVALKGVSLLPDPTGAPVLWIGTEHAGVLRVDVRDPRAPRVLPANLPAPPDVFVYDALRDSTGRIYICTNNGVQQLTPHGDGYRSRVFTRRDGMVHDECNTDARFIDAHDRYWTGTLGGLTVFDPLREIRDDRPKPLLLTGASIDANPVAVDPVRIERGAHSVRVEFALLSWQRESESRFRTRLVGYEAEPGAWNAENFREFSALPPGDYTLRVEARDYAGNLSTPLEVPIEMVAAWWQTDVALVLFTALGAVLVYVLLQWRTRQLKAQRSALEQRVQARTLELHEANSRLLELSYKDALTGLANRRRMLETLEEEPARDAPTALIFVDVDHFKEYNDRYGHPAGDEALRGVARVLREVAPSGALVARYGGEEFACLLPGCDAPQARALAERIRAAVAECEVAVPGEETRNRVTISAGVATQTLATAADAHHLLRSADVALYQAKRDGRNCVRG